MITPDSPLRAPFPSSALGQAIAYADDRGPSDTTETSVVVEYLSELARLCRLVGLDFRVLAAQSAEETATWTSFWWKTRRNPAGIGITGDDAQNAASQTWRTGTEAARAQVVHMAAYVYGDRGADTEWAPIITPLVRYDRRYEAVFSAGFDGTVHRLGDLGNGKWAADPKYATTISSIANAMFTEEPMTPPAKPTIHELSTDYARYGLEKWQADTIIAKRIENRLGYSAQGIVFHIQDGVTRGSLPYWVGVQASSTVMIQKDGTILNVIPRKHGPWTNGDSSNPSSRGNHLISLGGGDANRVSLTCEMEGTPGDQLTPAQKNAAVWWALDVMREFPHIGLDDFYRHADINSVTRPNCPDGYYPDLMAAIKAASSAPPPKPKPTIDWIRGETGLGTFNGTPVLKLVGAATLVADTTSRHGASTKAKAFKRYKRGQRVVVVGTFDSRWAVIDAGDGAFPRVAMNRLKPSYPTPKDVS